VNVFFSKLFSFQISNWMSTEILKVTTVNGRMELIVKFIHLAKQLFKFRNFSSLMAVLSCLHSSPIGKLRSSWEVCDKIFFHLLFIFLLFRMFHQKIRKRKHFFFFLKSSLRLFSGLV